MAEFFVQTLIGIVIMVIAICIDNLLADEKMRSNKKYGDQE